MDTEDRRYFKQQEITLWRKADKNRKSAMTSSTNPHVPSHLMVTHLVGSDGEIMSKPLSSTNSISSNTQSNADEIGDNRCDDNKNSEATEKTVNLFQEESPIQGRTNETHRVIVDGTNYGRLKSKCRFYQMKRVRFLSSCKKKFLHMRTFVPKWFHRIT